MGWWHNFPKYIVSLMRAWYGDNVGPHNEWGFQWLPRITGDHSQLPMMLALKDGRFEACSCPGRTRPSAGRTATSCAWGSPTSSGWSCAIRSRPRRPLSGTPRPRSSGASCGPRTSRPRSSSCPPRCPVEKDGTFTNTHRLIQWHDKLVDPPGDCRSETWFYYHLGAPSEGAVRGQHRSARRADPQPALGLPARRSAGRAERRRDPAGDQRLHLARTPSRSPTSRICRTTAPPRAAAGSTPASTRPTTATRRACAGPTAPRARARTSTGLLPGPATGASCTTARRRDPRAGPGRERKHYVWWDAEQGRWTGYDAPDFVSDKPPSYEPDWSQHPVGMDAHDGRSAFMMIADGKAGLFAPSGVKDGPLPTHYEPVESPVRNALYGQQDNPAAKRWERPDNVYHAGGRPALPLRHHHLPADRASRRRHADRAMYPPWPSCSPRASARFPRSWPSGSAIAMATGSSSTPRGTRSRPRRLSPPGCARS